MRAATHGERRRLRLTLSRACLGLACGLLLVVSDAPRAQTAGWTPDLHLKVKRVNQVTPSPDGLRVAYVVAQAALDGDKSEWLSQIHVVQADGSASFQLTRGDKSSWAASWSPDGQWLAFISSRAGRPAVWRINLSGGEAEKLTDERGSISAFEWSPDGASIAYVMKDAKTDDEETADREKRDWRTIDDNIKRNRLYLVPADANDQHRRPTRQLTRGDFSVMEFSWSPDGTTIVFSHQPTPAADDWARTDISTVDVGSGDVKPLAQTAAAERSPFYSPDGKWVVFEKSDIPPTWAFTTTLNVVAAEGGTPRALPETPDAQPDLIGWSADGARVYASEVQGTWPQILAVPVNGGGASIISPAGVLASTAGLNRSRTTIGFVSQSLDRAPEAFVSALAPELKPVQVSRAQDLPAAPIGRSEVISWQSADGLPIKGVLTYPEAYQKGARVPLLIVIHGGPTGVFTRSFIGTASPYPVAAFAAQGYAVLRCNVRGSGGYGRKFRYANMGDWGGGDYKDIMTGVDHVVAMGVADPDRLGVMGWSYGGYMTSWIVTQTRRFKAASCGAGVSNLMSFTGTSDIPSFIPDYFGGEYWDNFDAWRSHSAMFNVKGVTTPTLIQHGEADERVPVSQSYEFYNALKRQGVTTKLTVYPRQPHGFEEPKMTLDAARANLAWFDRWIGKAQPATGGKQ